MTAPRICQGGCGLNLDTDATLPMRADAQVCRESKCRKAWQRACARWIWDEQEHIWKCRGHGQIDEQSGKCGRCGQSFLPSREVRQAPDGLNIAADTRRIRGLLRGTMQRPSFGSGGRMPPYGTEPWDGEWLPLPKRIEPVRLDDVDSTAGPLAKDSDKFALLPYSLNRSEKRYPDQGAPWNEPERPLCVKQVVPTTIQQRRQDDALAVRREIVAAYSRGELSRDQAKARIEGVGTPPDPRPIREPQGRVVRLARLKAHVAEAHDELEELDPPMGLAA